MVTAFTNDRAGRNQRVAGAAAQVLRTAACVLLAASLMACGEYGGGEAAAPGPDTSGFGAQSGVSQDDQITAFEQTLWPLLRNRTCVNCHVSSDGQTPFKLADPNSTVAYFAIVDNNRVNFSNPGASRLVARLISDNHHCWSNCTADGAEMLLAIQGWIQSIEDMGGGPAGGTGVTQGTLSSDPLGQYEGVIDEGGERYLNNLIAYWKFNEYDPAGSPTVAADSSGVAPAIDLVLEGGADFMSSYGVDIPSGRAIASADQSRKLYDKIANPSTGTGQYSVEAWVVPANTTQEGPARIVTYSRDGGRRNFMIGQRMYQYILRNRTSGSDTNQNGTPALETYMADQDLQAALQHIVLTYDQANGRRFYVDGVFTDDFDEQDPATLWNWDPSYRLAIGAEVNNNSQFVGQVRMLAIYNQALTDAQIRQNYYAGVGYRVIMRFDVSQWVGPGSYIEMARSQIDDNAYLFCQPTLVTQNLGSRVTGLRIRINGIEPSAGQVFSNINTIVTSERQQLSRMCSIIENLTGDDTFEVVFEGLGQFVDPVPPTVYQPITYDYSGAQGLPNNGVRDFAKINETMLELTGVNAFAPSIGARVGDSPGETLQDVYDDLRQQLPDGADVRSFVSSHQVGIAKLALEYCDALVRDTTARTAFFDRAPAFDFTAAPAVAFVDDTLITGPLVEKMVAPSDVNQPAGSTVETMLSGLITDLQTDCAGTCDTQDIVAGVCTAALSSASMTMH